MSLFMGIAPREDVACSRRNSFSARPSLCCTWSSDTNGQMIRVTCSEASGPPNHLAMLLPCNHWPKRSADCLGLF